MNKNDTEAIVKEFLDLWQKQFSYISRDNDMVNQALEAFQKMQESYSEAMKSAQGKQSDDKFITTADIFCNISNEFSKLAKGYAGLEERVAKLESALYGEGEGSPGKARADRSKRTGSGNPKTGKR